MINVIRRTVMYAGFSGRVLNSLALGLLLLTPLAAQESLQPVVSGDSAVIRSWQGYNPMRLAQPNFPIENRSLLQYLTDSARHLLVEIGSEGKVVAAAAIDSIPDSTSRWMSICSLLQFDLLGDGSGEVTRRMVVIRISPDETGRNLRVRAPQTKGRPLDYRLLAVTLEKAGIELPKLRSFPSFYPMHQSPDSMLLPPVVLLRIETEASGKVLLSDVFSTTVPGISPQIEAAGLRSGITSPLTGDGKPNTAYLLVNLLSSGISPLPALKDSIVSEWFGFPRVTVLPDRPDSNELLCPPIPKADFRTLHWTECAGIAYSVPAKVAISKEGVTRVFIDLSVKRELRAKMDKRLREIRFFPAILTSGEPIDWRGSIRFEFSADGKLQVITDWL
jgi:hypothetical protein